MQLPRPSEAVKNSAELVDETLDRIQESGWTASRPDASMTPKHVLDRLHCQLNTANLFNENLRKILAVVCK